MPNYTAERQTATGNYDIYHGNMLVACCSAEYGERIIACLQKCEGAKQQPREGELYDILSKQRQNM